MLRDFTKDKYDILIQAGQSNAEGCGIGATEEPWEPDGRVWAMNGDFTVSPAAERVAGNVIQSDFSLAFVRDYIRNGRLAEGRSVLILRTAVGGTGFLDGHWKSEDDLYLRMIDMVRTALDLNPENRLIALLWHQGETDAVYNASFSCHYDNLMTLVRGVRSIFSRQDLPFIAGDFVQDWKSENAAICAPVVDAIRAVCRDCGRGGFVETDGLLSNRQEPANSQLGWDDPIHFSRKALYELGRRYYKTFETLI